MSLRHARFGDDTTDTTILPPTPPPGPPVTLFDSTGDSNDGSDSLFPNDQLGASFSTGASPVTLSTLEFVLEDGTPSDGGTIDVTLYSDSGTNPGGQIADLGTISDSILQPGSSTITLTVSGGTTLTAGTRYWIEMTDTSFASNAAWNFSLSNGGTGVSSEFIDYYGNVFPNGPDAGTLLMQVNAQGTCYAAGTHILTDRGEVAVQALRPGDLVVSARGGRLAPVRWVGHHHVDLRRHSIEEGMNPVRIRADACAPGVPHRDLILSPDHAVLLDGALISVRYLLNGATIVQEAWNEITYYHIELDQHDVLLAEGLAAESFLDVGNRAVFANGPGPVGLNASLDAAQAHSVWAAHACAPTHGGQAARTDVHQKLLHRALALGHETTDNPALHVLAGGRVLKPAPYAGALRFDLPPDTSRAVLHSRNVIPSHICPGTDGRLLGAGITFLALDDCPIALDHPSLTAGWHDAEPMLRWTKGTAVIETGGARSMVLRLHAGLTYWTGVSSARLTQAA